MLQTLIALQMNSKTDPLLNLDWVEKTLTPLQKSGPTLVVLPECFACFGGGDKAQLALAEQKGHGPIQQRLSEIARRFGVWLVAGTMPLKCADHNKFTASCLVYDDQGQLVTEYQKVHLFDVEVNDNTRSYHESAHTQAGTRVVTFDSPFGKVGVAVCFDVRFPHLFQAMNKPDVIVLPSAFTKVTGEAHWQALLKCRSIENQCYLVAAGQTGIHENGRETYGHSQIVSPWGEVLAMKTSGTGLVMADMNLKDVAEIRQKMPLHPASLD
ncbi:carbon-nitrogen hydrolase family protein [Neptunicella marina]|uniref:Carbon-nitrogen hydrolase family protein n=1 Tax=Neptunicella marina TaxID=2125989 RepID=A0A8J6ITN8_9ALTE|nr:carbon-nitrogen hydrolase family protein [Neptunicella marina]MBC3766124.1 carbon-nitrogen hydrolase family protein [Neptunicella marina]